MTGCVNHIRIDLHIISLHNTATPTDNRHNETEGATRICWDALRLSGERLSAASVAVTNLACVTPAGCRSRQTGRIELCVKVASLGCAIPAD